MVPVLATNAEGNVVFGLHAVDFYLTYNGVPQEVSIEDDSDSQPLALAIVTETGGAGARIRKMSDAELRKYGRAARDLSDPKNNYGKPNPSFGMQSWQIGIEFLSGRH
jgi:hypothetical protein